MKNVLMFLVALNMGVSAYANTVTPDYSFIEVPKDKTVLNRKLIFIEENDLIIGEFYGKTALEFKNGETQIVRYDRHLREDYDKEAFKTLSDLGYSAREVVTGKILGNKDKAFEKFKGRLNRCMVRTGGPGIGETYRDEMICLSGFRTIYALDLKSKDSEKFKKLESILGSDVTILAQKEKFNVGCDLIASIRHSSECKRTRLVNIIQADDEKFYQEL